MRQTHELEIGPKEVRKRFVSWAEREPEREWDALHVLDRLAPGLAPRPLRRSVEFGKPVVVMSRLPGASLGSAPLTRGQTSALAGALSRLFAVHVDSGLYERAYGPTTMRAFVRAWAAESYDLAPCVDPRLVDRAMNLAREWLRSGGEAVDRVVDPVLAQGDGNVHNVVWDGAVCRLVDFEAFGVSDIAYEVADVVEHGSSRLYALLPTHQLVEALGLDDQQSKRLGPTDCCWRPSGW